MTNAMTSSGLFGTIYSDERIAAEFTAVAFGGRMLAFEAAWTRALTAQGIVGKDAADAALAAIHAFDAGRIGEGSDKDGLPVPEMVKALRSGLDADAKAALHTGLTSQDVIDTAMVLALLAVLETLDARLKSLLQILNGLVGSFGDNHLMARTRMQAALPATVALRLNAWKRTIEGHLHRVRPLREEIGLVQIGGPIGRRDAPQVDLEDMVARVAAELALATAPVWHTDRSRFVSFGHWLTLVAGTMGKIGQDIALMAQQGVDEIAIAGGGGSSAMPHKQNPVWAEAAVSLARFVGVQQGALAQAMIHEQERSGVAWAMEWLTLPAMAEATGAAINQVETLFARVERIGTPE